MLGRCFIAGSWIATDRSFPVVDPATGATVGTAADAGPSEVTGALDAAADALPMWSAMLATERAEIMRRVSSEVMADKERIADIIVAEQGKTLGQAPIRGPLYHRVDRLVRRGGAPDLRPDHPSHGSR